MHARTRLSVCGHDCEWNATRLLGQNWQNTVLACFHCSVVASLTIVRISIIRSAVLVNQSSVLQFLWTTLSSIGPKLIKAALD